MESGAPARTHLRGAQLGQVQVPSGLHTLHPAYAWCSWLQAFLQYYYQLFESNRAGLANLYQEGSMLTFEGQKFQGTQAIVAKLAALPFNQAKVNPTSMDFQPSVAGGIMVFVTGSIQVCVLLQALPQKQQLRTAVLLQDW